MCLAIPMEIVKIKGDTAMARADGLEREVDVRFLKDVKKGDFVVIHAGFAIEKIDKKNAEETIKLYKEMKR
ncbi:MAG: HypC/HybG/HupF family hydrogenase formation chaperone [Candidatus Omnitrophota bacterium]